MEAGPWLMTWDVSVFSSAIYASRLYLNQYHTTHPERLSSDAEGGPKIRGKFSNSAALVLFNCTVGPYRSLISQGNVYIHPTANIDPTAMVSFHHVWTIDRIKGVICSSFVFIYFPPYTFRQSDRVTVGAWRLAPTYLC